MAVLCCSERTYWIVSQLLLLRVTVDKILSHVQPYSTEVSQLLNLYELSFL